MTLIEQKKDKTQSDAAVNIICIMLTTYIFLSYFEIYIQQYLGPVNRFFMLAMAGVFLILYRFKLQMNIYTFFIILWFVFKCVSLFWSDGSNGQEVSNHVASQIGIVLMTAILSGNEFNKKIMDWCIKSIFLFSFLYGALSIPFSQAYRGSFTGRQVLTLFGAQNDPNNNAAFLIFAVSIALYSLVFEHRHMILNTIIILINSYAIFLTGSRTGFLSLIFVVGVIIMIIPFRRRNTGEKEYPFLSIMSIIFLGLVLVYLSGNILPANIRERLLAFNEYEEGSGRASKWENAMRLFWEAPLFGKGWGGYVLEGYNEGGVHNTFITSLCDGGAIGTVLLVVPIMCIVVQSIRKKEILAIIILADGIFFSFTLDAINKRFFWNAIYIAIMLLNYDASHSEIIYIWNRRKTQTPESIKESKCKYIR